MEKKSIGIYVDEGSHVIASDNTFNGLDTALYATGKSTAEFHGNIVVSKEVLLALNQIQIRVEESLIPTEKKEAILQSVEAMRQSAGTANFKEKYKDFISIAADHLTLFQAFISPLSVLL